jgi:hypothetical protein
VAVSRAALLSPLRRIRAARRPRWWQEIGFIVGVYLLYSLTRDVVPSHEAVARHRAASLLSIERFLHLDGEHAVNAFVAHAELGGTHVLAYACDYYYSTLHFAVTIGVLVWLFVYHPSRYRSIRSVLLITNLLALLGFWLLPLAPPRMLPGFVDTVVQFHTWGSLASPAVANSSNQFAAMPSLHIAWALWCAFAIVTLARRQWVRVLGALYPLATCFVILGTANHYVLDALGGVATLAVGVVAQRVLSGRAAYLSLPAALPRDDEDRELVAA